MTEDCIVPRESSPNSRNDDDKGGWFWSETGCGKKMNEQEMEVWVTEGEYD